MTFCSMFHLCGRRVAPIIPVAVRLLPRFRSLSSSLSFQSRLHISTRCFASMNSSINVQKLATDVSVADRRALGQAITLVESTLPKHEELAMELMSLVLQSSPPSSRRIGISGPPGAGKSTFIEKFGMALVEKGHRVAVLAVDPSSQSSGGSLLADKTRMSALSSHPSAYVRPSPTRGSLGGITDHTDEALLLCEAAGFDHIIVETVGVGQSEVGVTDIVDMLMLVLPPAGGDQWQGLKKGVMEMADLLIINKADGDTIHVANQSQRNYAAAVQLLRPHINHWKTQVVTCSSLIHSDIDSIHNIYSIVNNFFENTKTSNELEARRVQQRLNWTHQLLHSKLFRCLRSQKNSFMRKTEKDLIMNKITPRFAVKSILQQFFQKNESNLK